MLLRAPARDRLDVADLAGSVVRGFGENDLLTFASAIALRIMTALIPLLMFALALLGFLHLTEAWQQHLAPQLRADTSPQVFAVVDEAVRTVLERRQLFWLTAGLLIAVWEVSGGVRAVMDALSRIYGTRDDRPKLRRFLVSFALAIAVAPCLLSAFAVLNFATDVLDDTVVSVLRWPVAVVLLITAVWLLVRYAPAQRQPVSWVSEGTVLCVVSWVVTSVVYAIYVTRIADYASIFSSLATLFLLLTYLYLSACAFLAGAQLDAVIRARSTGSATGARAPGSRRTSP